MDRNDTDLAGNARPRCVTDGCDRLVYTSTYGLCYQCWIDSSERYRRFLAPPKEVKAP